MSTQSVCEYFGMVSDLNIKLQTWPMFDETHLPFLKEKIQDLSSALFFSMSNAVLKIPTTIISALKVDEVGQIWFFIHRPTQHIQEFDKQFPARLEFFRKGKPFFLKISGKACIVNDPEEVTGLVTVTDEIKQRALTQMVLVKVKIQTAEYHEKSIPMASNWVQNVRTHFNRWLFKPEPAFELRGRPIYSH